MTPETQLPWGQTTAGIVVVNGVVTAVVSALVTWLINNATSLPWLWVVTIFAAIAVFTFLALSLARRQLRETIWNRPWRWVRGLRLSTVRQRQREATHIRARTLAEANLTTKSLIAHAEDRVAAAESNRVALQEERDLLAQENARLSLQLHQQTEHLRSLERQSPSSESQLPRPAPRWRVYADEDSADGTDFRLSNPVPRSTAREVRIDSDSDMAILDAGHWQDLSGESIGNFRAELTRVGWEQGVAISITWYDENNLRHDGSAYLPGRRD